MNSWVSMNIFVNHLATYMSRVAGLYKSENKEKNKAWVHAESPLALNSVSRKTRNQQDFINPKQALYHSRRQLAETRTHIPIIAEVKLKEVTFGE